MINTKKYKQLHNLEINFCRHFKIDTTVTKYILEDYREENKEYNLDIILKDEKLYKDFLEKYTEELELYLFQSLDCLIDLENREENIKYCFKNIDKFKEIIKE